MLYLWCLKSKLLNDAWVTCKFKLHLHGSDHHSVDASQMEVLQNRVTCRLAQFKLYLIVGSIMWQCHKGQQSCKSATGQVSVPFRSWLSSCWLGAGVSPGFNYSQVGLDLSWLTWRWTYSWNLSQESFISSPLQTTQSLSCSKNHWCRKFTSKNSLWCRDKLFPD